MHRITKLFIDYVTQLPGFLLSWNPPTRFVKKNSVTEKRFQNFAATRFSGERVTQNKFSLRFRPRIVTPTELCSNVSTQSLSLSRSRILSRSLFYSRKERSNLKGIPRILNLALCFRDLKIQLHIFLNIVKSRRNFAADAISKSSLW